MVATTSEAVEERAPESQESEPVEVSETPETQASDTAPQEIADVASETRDPDFPEIAFDINSFPEDQREAAQKAYDKVNADFKRAYTPKFQDLKSRDQLRDQEVEQLNQKIQGWSQIAQEVMKDPSKLEAYRRIYFPDSEQPAAETPKEFATVEELVNHYETQLKTTQETVLEQARREAAAEVARSNREMRWDSALNAARQDPTFARYEKEILANVRGDQKYKGVFNGSNETEVLQKGLSDFKEKLSQDKEEARQEILKSNAQKKAATTMAPRKATTTSAGGEAGASDNVVLERIRRRLAEV
jgi:hypothetical protein